MASERPPKRVTYSPQAIADGQAIYAQTVVLWGERQADRYLEFLADTTQLLSDFPGLGRAVADSPGQRAFYAKWPKACYGHQLIYRSTENGIEILRIIHGANQRN